MATAVASCTPQLHLRCAVLALRGAWWRAARDGLWLDGILGGLAGGGVCVFLCGQCIHIWKSAHMDRLRANARTVFSSASHLSILHAWRGRNKAPAMAKRPMPPSAPASLGRPPSVGKLHTRPGYVGERAAITIVIFSTVGLGADSSECYGSSIVCTR